MGISIVIVRAIADELQRREIDARALLADAGLPLEWLDDPHAFVEAPLYAAVLDAVVRATEADPELGLRAGANAEASTLHVLGPVVMACATLREAAELFLRYMPLVAEDASFALRIEDGRGILSYEHRSQPERHAHYDAEFAFAYVNSVARRFVREGFATEVRFRHRGPADRTYYERLFGCAVRFRCDENVILFDPAGLEVRHTHANPALLEILREHAELLLARRRQPERLPARIRDLVRRSESPAAIDIATIAETLGVGVRTLRRQLDGSEGGVRAIVESTKQEMAESLLRNPDLPIKEIAFRLGFSEPSAFHRAWKRWTGTTPAEFRASVRGEAKANDGGTMRQPRPARHFAAVAATESDTQPAPTRRAAGRA